MLIDLRTYTYHPARFRAFLKGYEEVGFALTSKHLGRTLGVFRSDSGVMNRTFQFFVYEDSAHRDRCRQGMLADPEWGKFVKLDGDALREQMNELLRPLPFSPFGGPEGAWPGAADAPRLFELRRWRAQPPQWDAACDLIAGRGAALFAQHLDVVGYFRVEMGDTHQLLMLSAHRDDAARSAAWEALGASAAGASLMGELRTHLAGEHVTQLAPMTYSPLR